MRSEAAARADFSGIRYAQCWEDADILVQALDPRPGYRCLSIASAGDNALALLSRSPERVLAVDLSAAQLAALELRVAAFQELQREQVLALIGCIESDERLELYSRCRKHLSEEAREFWDERASCIKAGVGSAGKFERYFSLFRTRVLPLVHSGSHVMALLSEKSMAERCAFYDSVWDNWRWRFMFRVFFSKPVMGSFGRDPEFFRYVNGSVGGRILDRTRYALRELDPARNPYVQWILTGRYSDDALPFYLRAENFDSIRKNLDRLEWRCGELEEVLESCPHEFNAFNLSDIFEYMSEANYERLLRLVIRAAKRGARLAYWNMLVPRRRPESLAGSLRPLPELSDALFARDQAFFYSAFVVEEVL